MDVHRNFDADERMTSVAQNSDTPSSVGIGAFHAIVPAIHPVGAPNSPGRAPAPPEGAWGEGPGRRSGASRSARSVVLAPVVEDVPGAGVTQQRSGEGGSRRPRRRRTRTTAGSRRPRSLARTSGRGDRWSSEESCGDLRRSAAPWRRSRARPSTRPDHRGPIPSDGCRRRAPADTGRTARRRGRAIRLLLRASRAAGGAPEASVVPRKALARPATGAWRARGAVRPGTRREAP